MARFFGASSPNTICAIGGEDEGEGERDPERSGVGQAERRVSAGSINPAIAGSAMKPRTSVVTVMPSCAPDSMKLSRLMDRHGAARLPVVLGGFGELPRRAATKANSPATKYPLATINAIDREDSERIQHGVNFDVGRRTWPPR